MAINLESAAIKSVSYYVASPVESCDRCAAAIKNVFVVHYRDGEIQKYGSECINKILANAPTLKALFQKNMKKLKTYKNYLAILSGPVEDMPRGSEYFGSGLYFIGDGSTGKGSDISFNGHWFFHPIFDVEKNESGTRYVQSDHGITPEAFAATQIAEYKSRDEAKLIAQIARLELFLAKILRNVPNAEKLAAQSKGQA